MEARSLWPERGTACILSVGTGAPPSSLRDTVISDGTSFTNFADIATDSEQTHQDVHHYVASHHIQDIYYRLNPPELGKFLLNESRPEKLAEMIDSTTEYLNTKEVMVQLDKLCELLSTKRV